MSSSDDQDARKNGEDSPRSSFKSKSPSRSRSRSMSVENERARRSHSSSSNDSASPKEKSEDKLMDTSDVHEENFKSDRKDSDIENNISYKNEEKSRSRSKSKSRGKSRSKTKSRSKSRSRSRSRSKGSGSPKKISRRSRSRSRSRRRSGSHSRRRRSSMRRRSRSPRRRSRSRRRRSRSRSATPIDGARLHVAELDVETRKRDLEKIFEKFGRLREIWMARNPPCFAFVVYNRQKDSDRAMRETDGMMVGHCRIKVTQARPRVRGGRFRGGYDPNLRCYQCGELGHFSRNCTDTKFGYKRPPTPPGMCNGVVL